MSELASGLASTANAAPAAAESAPAPSSSTPAASGPISLSDAFAQFDVGKEESTPVTPETPVPSGEAPTIAEPPQDQAQAGETKPGPIPFDVHKTALENARKKASEEFSQQYAEAMQFAQSFNADPIGTFMHLGQQLQNHPEFGQALRSTAGRMLAAQRQRQPQQPAAEPEPTPDVIFRYSDGTEGRTFSAEQLAKRDAWREKQTEQRLLDRFAPLSKLQEQWQHAQKLEQQTHEYVQRQAPLAEELQAMPGFKEHLSDIKAKQTELMHSVPNADPMRMWFRAYREVVPAKLQQQQQDQLASSAMQKAAGRDANPGTVVGSSPAAPRSMQEALAQVGLR